MMTRLSTLAIAIAVAVGTVTPALADPPRWHDDRGRDHRDDRRGRDGHWRGAPPRDRGAYANPFRRGDRFDYRRAPNYRVIEYRDYRLRRPPRGYHWVRSGNDALLVAIATGVIASIAVNQFGQ